MKRFILATLVTLCTAAFPQLLQAQTLSVTGRVLSKSGNEPLVGATVQLAGKETAALTNASGVFTISAERGATLLISYAGMKTLQVTVTGPSLDDILLEEQVQGMNEVVVIGYGARKRRDLSTSISSVGSKEITATPVADAAQALQGRVAGVTIIQNSGAPGGTGGTSIRIRGISSLTGTNNPLIVVDGYPLPDQQADNVLNSFGVGDIESIDVLKDAAAASIYGVRASNGVIMITTKRGKAGKTTMNVDVYRGIQEAWRLPTMMNARQYAIANTEARVASGLPPHSQIAGFKRH